MLRKGAGGMNKYAVANLTKRANARADLEGLDGVARNVFVFIAVNAGVGFVSLSRAFEINSLVVAMAELMDAGLLFEMYSADRYYTVAI